MSDVTTGGVVFDNPRFTIVSAEAQWLSDDDALGGARIFSRASLGVAGYAGSTFGAAAFTSGIQFPLSMVSVQPGVALEGVVFNSRSGLPVHTRISFVVGLD